MAAVRDNTGMGDASNSMGGSGGEYKRHDSKHRPAVHEIAVETGRYHLHVSLACPWAAGTLSMLLLKGLEDAVGFSVVHPTWQRTRPESEADTHCGWVYRSPGQPPLANPLGHGSNECDGANVPDFATDCKSIREVYELGGDFEGPFTTPLLWDKKENKIVCNESMVILQILNTRFDAMSRAPGTTDFYPGGVAGAALSTLNAELVYPKVNNGVYRSGFAKTQQAYAAAVTSLFAGLEELEQRLGRTRFLGGDTFSWLDLRLYHTLVRFDPVYTCYFKTNAKQIADFPNLLGFVRDMYSIEAVCSTTNIAHIKTHYFTSHPLLNHFGIIPIGEGPDLTVAHGRDVRDYDYAAPPAPAE